MVVYVTLKLELDEYLKLVKAALKEKKRFEELVVEMVKLYLTLHSNNSDRYGDRKDS